MPRLLAIADDLSGAAEIAGIGHRFGLPTKIVRDCLPDRSDGSGLTVLDTDSRSLDAEGAARAVREALAWWEPAQYELTYKKVDSVLRGQIRAELSALARVVGGRRTPLLLAQNPSRGRVIDAGGEYFIDDLPLDRTSFADDPDHPARSSDARELLGDANAVCRTADQELPSPGLTTIAAAASLDDVARWARRVVSDPSILPAGSGDFFTAILGASGLCAREQFVERLSPGRALFVCGSASAYSRRLAQTAAARGVTIQEMPDEVFAGSASTDTWSHQVLDALTAGNGRVLVFIPQSLDRSASQRLQTALAELTAKILASQTVENLLLEGGATASAVCRRMGWNRLDVTGEFAPGVVRLNAGEINLIIKPGSYPWPAGIWELP